MSPIAIQFTAPQTVSLVDPSQLRPADTPSSPVAHLRTLYSAVSAGTELLIYNNQMPRDIPLDKTIASHASSFDYPCLYGYSAVAEVVQDETETYSPGTHVFAFREHSSHFDELPTALHRIPDGVHDHDAVFLPNMETAISLIMDASPLPGDTVCVVGQGIVGLLVVAALRLLHPYSTIISLDLEASRRELSVNAAGANASYDPSKSDFFNCTTKSTPFEADVAIDVSGSGSGLQAAIDVTRDYGRVVIGSWFGSKEVILPRLGGRFHRSHITLIASQVSELPVHIRDRWTKSRRLDLAWQLIRDMKPSDRFPIHFTAINKAPEVYREIAESKHLQVVFRY